MLATAAASAQPSAPVATILPHLGAVDASVYFEVADTTEMGEGFAIAQVFAGRVADALEELGTVDEDAIAMVRRAPDALHELGLFSVAGFGRSVADEGNGVRLHRSFWAGGAARVWDLVATDAPAPVDCLPADSVLAIASSADPRAFWDVARAVYGTLAPDALESFDKAVKSVRAGMGIDVPALVASLRPGVFAALTLDPDKTVVLGDGAAPLPSSGLVLGVRAETRDLLVKLSALALGAGVPLRVSERGPNGEEGFVIDLPPEATAGLPFEFAPTLLWSPAKKMLVLATTRALASNALEDGADAPKLVDAQAFKERAAGLPADGTLRWLSPELLRTIVFYVSTRLEEDDGAPALVKEALVGAGDGWYVGRSRRFPDGLESVSRSTFSSPAVSRCVLELYQGSGLLAAGFLAGMAVPAVRSVQQGATSTKIANAGRNVVLAIQMANLDREAAAKSPVWPTKGKWESSTDYFGKLVARDLLEGVAPDELFAPGWCCLAGIEGESDFMPFLWSPNLELDEEDFAHPVDPAHPVDWSDKVSDGEPVVLVRKGGAMQVIKPKLLTDAVFFAGAAPAHPENLEVLRPEPDGR